MQVSENEKKAFIVEIPSNTLNVDGKGNNLIDKVNRNVTGALVGAGIGLIVALYFQKSKFLFITGGGFTGAIIANYIKKYKK